MNRDQNFLPGMGHLDQFAQSGLGFTKRGDHVTTMVLFRDFSKRGNPIKVMARSSPHGDVTRRIDRAVKPLEAKSSRALGLECPQI
jgi:hypothetical protein